MHKGQQCSSDSIAEEFQTSTGINISAKTVQRKLHGMGLYGQTACKFHITKYNG